MSEKLERLTRGLELAGVKKYGRNLAVAEKTGYSPSSVAKLLQGWTPTTDKFISAVCEAFGIDDYWVRTGKAPTLLAARGVYDKDMGEIEDSPGKNRTLFIGSLSKRALENLGVITSEQLKEVAEDHTLSRATIELLKMSQPDRLRALAMLMEMNSKDGDADGNADE